jgi:hypothetical protein
MRLLTQKRGLTRIQAIRFGTTVRARSYGWIRSILQTLAIVLVDSLRRLVVTTVLYSLIKPIVLVRNVIKAILPNKKTTSEPIK